MENIPFAAAMAKTFRRSDETPGQFAAQLSKLNNEDRAWYHRELNAAGIECDEPRQK